MAAFIGSEAVAGRDWPCRRRGKQRQPAGEQQSERFVQGKSGMEDRGWTLLMIAISQSASDHTACSPRRWGHRVAESGMADLLFQFLPQRFEFGFDLRGSGAVDRRGRGASTGFW